jgi:hypothetical protein
MVGIDKVLSHTHKIWSGMTADFRLVVKMHGNGSRFEVQPEVQNVRGSTLRRYERHPTATSVASENARRAGRARRAIGQFGLSGLSSQVLDETRDDSARLAACLQILSKRFLLQHDEDAKGKVATQSTQETFKS